MAMSAEATKELRMAYDADPVTLDIHEQLSGGMLQLSHMAFDPLVRWTKDLDFEPRLATSWERIDDKTMRFKLRKGVTFHSGNKLTTKDVKFTFDRLKKSQDFKAIFQPFSGINVIDDYTFDLVTKEPFPLLLNTATYIFPMDSKFYTGKTKDGKDKSAIIKNGNSFASTHLSGTGPYIVTKRQQGVRVEFKRFDDYWDTKSPGNVGKIILTPIKENNTRVSALLSGDVDFIAPVPPNDLDRIRRDKKIDHGHHERHPHHYAGSEPEAG
jgi:peptide/nickel transport system substrate-binding protein